LSSAVFWTTCFLSGFFWHRSDPSVLRTAPLGKGSSLIEHHFHLGSSLMVHYFHQGSSLIVHHFHLGSSLIVHYFHQGSSLIVHYFYQWSSSMVPAGSPPLEGEYPAGGRGLLHHKMNPSVLRTAPLGKGSSLIVLHFHQGSSLMVHYFHQGRSLMVLHFH